jgi:hypothetical protein
MSITQREQFVYENKTWGRSLDFSRQENSFLKNRLSVIIDCKEDKAFLVVAEFFLNQLIQKDEFIDDLKKDLNSQEKFINDNFNDENFPVILKKHEKLRNEIGFFEKEFASLKHEFNKSITQAL